MATMDVEQRLPGDLAEPAEQRNGRSRQETVDAPRNFNVRLLDDVGRIDAPEQSRIESKVDHPLQPVSIVEENRRQRILAAQPQPP